MILERVISGGQSGVDIAALRAAKRAGIATGGWLPNGCHTLDGPRREYVREYGMVEHRSSSYATRTYANVKDSDATMRIARTFDSTGEKCTLKAIEKYEKPYADVFVYEGKIRTVKMYAPPYGPPYGPQDPDWISIDGPRDGWHFRLIDAWVKRFNIRTLNVAGNSERTAPGIGVIAEQFVAEMIEALRVQS